MLSLQRSPQDPGTAGSAAAGGALDAEQAKAALKTEARVKQQLDAAATLDAATERGYRLAVAPSPRPTARLITQPTAPLVSAALATWIMDTPCREYAIRIGWVAPPCCRTRQSV